MGRGGFLNIQQLNVKEHYAIGWIRQRLTGICLQNISFPSGIPPRKYHIRVTETKEQKMRLIKDGIKVIDATHTQRQSEKSYE